MTTTWNDIRLSSLQKMFLVSGSEVVESDATMEYLNAMPGAYNEAVRLISTSNRQITRQADYEHDGMGESLVIDIGEIADIYRLHTSGIYFKPDGEYRWKPFSRYEQIGQVITVSDAEAGTYRLFYEAYPMTVTLSTAGDTVLDIDDDVASLIPLYIASQLYKDDDASMATIYRNEFEIGRELLVHDRYRSKSGRFRSESGWL